MSPEEEVKDALPRFSWKRFLIEFAIALGSCGGIFGAIFAYEYHALGYFYATPYRVISDSFVYAGGLGILLWALVFRSSFGAFDMIVYGVRKFLVIIFRIHPEKSKLPPTYYDYVNAKHEKPRSRFYGFMAGCAVVLAVGIVFALISLNLEY